MCVYDREGSQASQDLLKHFQASEYFDLVRTFQNYHSIVHAIDSGECTFGIVIPHDFSHLLKVGGAVPVQALVDATNDNTANLVIGYSDAVLSTYSANIQSEWIADHGYPKFRPPIRIDDRTWFNEDLESRNFIVPGVIALVMAVMGTFLTSLTIAREWERGTMEQLVSTPLTSLELVVGKLIPYFAIGMAGTAVCAAIGVFWFEVPFRGSALTLFGGSALFLVAVLGLGVWISAMARGQLVACQVSIVVTYMPSFILSGFVFAIDQMPLPVRAITHIVAARYYNLILRGVFLKGIGWWDLRIPMMALAILGLTTVALAIATFKKRID
jgi:ABC-2 type transport system permease protein